jgi:hypothetical protein
MPEAIEKINLQKALELLYQLTGFLEQAAKAGTSAHEVEGMIFKSMLKMGFELLNAFFTSCGKGDEGEEKILADGRKLKRMPELHEKPHQSVFGEIKIERVVYATRSGQKIEYAPLDARLQLPEGKYSYLLTDWSQGMAVDMPYAQAGKHLEKILGLKICVSALERQDRNLGASVQEFWENREPPPQVETDEIVVATSDGKGIPIRRDGCKRMSLVGAVYNIQPYQRTSEEVLGALFAEPDGKKANTQARPSPVAKYVRAALQRDEEGSMQPSYNNIFTWLADEVGQRDPSHVHPLVVVMDGQETLWDAAGQHFTGDVVEVLDLLHAAGYVRKAAALFYSDHRYQEIFAKFVMGYLLRGEVSIVLTILDIWGEEAELQDKPKDELRIIRGYLKKNAGRMRYDEYLAAGYPIASGVIEGACRYVIKDRMERTGMRWSMTGAQTMLELRCVSVNEEWDTFMSFHVGRENQRLYPWMAANDEETPMSFSKVA